MSECTRLPTDEPSVSTVLTIPELLEPILLCLDMRSLLTSAIRVCRQWRDLIQGSNLLQRALFFKIEEKPAGSEEVTFNPLLVELFPILFNFAGATDPRGINDLAIEALPIGQRRVAFYRRDASWRRMHIRQPPVKDVGLWTRDSIGGRQEKMRMVKYKGGLRMEGFYFLVLKHVYWWNVYVKWGEAQGRHFHYCQCRRNYRCAERMVRTADVIIEADAYPGCNWEEDARKPMDGSGLVRMKMGRPLAAHDDRTNEEKVRKHMESNGLVKMGIFWFKAVEIDDWEVMWERNDGVTRTPYAVPL